MKLPGYCEKCHRIKQVRVTRLMPGRMQVGICANCEEAEQERRNDRRGRRSW